MEQTIIFRDNLGRFSKGTKTPKPFKKGNIPPFKGKKGIHVSPKSEFKKGCIPWNKGLSIDDIRVKKNLERRYKTMEKNGFPKGEQIYCWKGGISTINSKIRNSIIYKRWRKSVFIRDNYSCRDCGKRGGSLQAHHILPFSTHPDLRFETDNGKTLCISCHKRYPKPVNKKK